MLSRLRLHKDERGISTVIVAVSLIGLIGAVLLALDYGNTVTTRRNIIIGTDSTALDQAKYLAFAADPSQCSNGSVTGTPSWEDYMLRNSGGALGVEAINCVVTNNGDGTGHVIVRGRKEAQTRFGSMFGIGNTEPYSLSAAQWGYITEAEGLRPMGICAENEHIQEWLANQNETLSDEDYANLRGNPITEHPIYTGAGVVHRVYFTKDNPDQCGSEAAGNWGWMDFECNNDGDTASSLCNNPDAELVEWIRNGYQSPVGVEDCDADAETGGETGDYCNGNTGSRGGSVESALQTLVDNQTEFAIPIFDTATEEPGNNVYFNMKYFVGVRLWDFEVKGPAGGRYFDFEFINLVTSGNCCAPAPEIDTGLRGIKICAVDHDPAGGSEESFVSQRCVATT